MPGYDATGAVAKRAKKTLKNDKKAAKLKDFANIYFENFPDREYSNITDEDLTAHLQSAFDFYSNRSEKNINVRVFNPEWTTDYTVIEVLMDDQAFVVDTIWSELGSHDLFIRHTIHPIVNSKRDGKGKLKAFEVSTDAAPRDGWARESFVHVEVRRQSDARKFKKIEKNVREALVLAQCASEDFPKMASKLTTIVAAAEKTIEPTAVNQETLAFLEWLLYKNFIFLGYRHYDLKWESKKDGIMTATRGSGLGIMKIDEDSSTFKPTRLSNLPPNMQHYMTMPNLVTITKTLNKSRVHRPADLDYIGIKEFDKDGRVIGEHRFTGLFTSRAYTTSARDIPVVGYKIEQVLRKASKSGAKHYNYKSLVNILSTYPKDELFQISIEDLERISNGILHLQERPQVRLFVRENYRERLVSALLFVPRDRMSSALRKKAISILEKAYDAEDIEWTVNLSESRLAQLFFKIRTKKAVPLKVAATTVEKEIDDATRPWSESLYFSLIKTQGEAEGSRLFDRYAHAFQAGYCEHTPSEVALEDIHVLENMLKEKVAFDVSVVTKKMPSASSDYRVKVFHKDTQISLSDIMPTFEQIGLYITTEHPSQIKDADGNIVWLHDFGIKLPEGQKLSTESRDLLKETIMLAWSGELESDRLNSLILSGLNISQVITLRAYAAYTHQISERYSKEYIQETLVKHPILSKILAEIFDARFDIKMSLANSEKALKNLYRRMNTSLKSVTVLDEDRIIQRLHDIIQATVRTNAWQRAAITDPLAFKIKGGDIPNMVKPVPLFEIFVYHTRVEGVHLRGGMVARGGLRWSDRPTDFRTEVLGLMKAQMVKNAIIVPTGSKGGFVLKTPPCDLKNMKTCDRNTLMEAVKASYSIFISSLLSVTDNMVQGKVIAPRNVRRYDSNDPYFVVAADKGTATFSDLANSIAQSADFWPVQKGQVKKGFWLGDAFASGGSNGYDHKKMGITARGAWECVKHNFRLVDHDIQTKPFTCVGIGDMAGDVFGNGMLLSKKTKLIAAFNHMHIFIDPNPNTEKSWVERKRLFDQPHSSWEDYNEKKISKGGGIFSRSEKSITLTPEIKALIGTKEKALPPNALIRALLTAEIDLLWNGGIGTFVKAVQETHQDVSDRANDDIRVNGNEVRAKVIGEGGNLGCTQLGRIEYTLNGGRMNTDSIDNSAGVATSDREVNIKILLDQIQQEGKLTESARNKILEDMTDDVAEQVLTDNYLQSQAITLANLAGTEGIDVCLRLIEHLASRNLLDPIIEFLPTKEEMEKRRQQGKGFTRPELSVLIAYAKDELYEELNQSGMTDIEKTKSIMPYLTHYFPTLLHKKYLNRILEHPLRREIVGTEIANEVINRMGITFLDRMREETGRSPSTVARAFIISKRLFKGDIWWDEIESLDNQIPSAVQFELHSVLKDVIEYGAFWVLRNCSLPLSLSEEENRFGPAFKEISAYLEAQNGTENAHRAKRIDKWVKQGLNKKLAEKYSLLPQLVVMPDLAAICINNKKHSAETVTNVYFTVGEKLQLENLRIQVRKLKALSNWQRVASQTSMDDLYVYQKAITNEVMALLKKDGDVEEAFAAWSVKNKNSAKRYTELLEEIARQPAVTHDMIVVIKGQLRSLFSRSFG